MEKKLSNQLIGSAGEYFVAGELSRRGIVAALTMAGTDAFDILAVNDTGRQFTVQVKTTRDKFSWLLSAKDEETRGENAYYVFVRLAGETLPEYYILPATTVAETLRQDYESWLHAPGKNHRPTNIRELRLPPQDPHSFNRWEYFLG